MSPRRQATAAGMGPVIGATRPRRSSAPSQSPSPAAPARRPCRSPACADPAEGCRPRPRLPTRDRMRRPPIRRLPTSPPDPRGLWPSSAVAGHRRHDRCPPTKPPRLAVGRGRGAAPAPAARRGGSGGRPTSSRPRRRCGRRGRQTADLIGRPWARDDRRQLRREPVYVRETTEQVDHFGGLALEDLGYEGSAIGPVRPRIRSTASARSGAASIRSRSAVRRTAAGQPLVRA